MPQTVFVVEDDKHINQVVSEYLKEAGYIVLSTADGKAARELLRTEKIDLFILDIMLPEISGLELLKIIREDARHSKNPVIMLTAISDEYTQLLSFEGLADDYITKPFSPKVLVKRVQALLRRSGAHETALPLPLRFGSISLYSDSYEVYENEERVNLTLREYELLSILLKNQRKVLTRQQLLNHAWGYDYFGDERIVDVHIKNLRKKLKSNIITTVKGVGYKLEAPAEGGNRLDP